MVKNFLEISHPALQGSYFCRLLLLLTLFIFSLPDGSKAQSPSSGGVWPLTAGSGTVAKEDSGNHYDGSLVGPAAWAQPGHDAPFALALDGGSFVDIPHTVVNISKSFTVSAWVRVNKIGGYQTFVSEDGSQVSGFYLQLRAGGSFAFTMLPIDSSTAVAAVASASVSVQPGVWYQLLGDYDAADHNISLFVDGVLQQTVPVTVLWQATGHTEIGRGKFAGQPTDFVNGEISDVHIGQGVVIDQSRMLAIAHETGALSPVISLALNLPGPEINPDMFGLMVEDVNHAIDGGLYAELIQNRVFKDNMNNPVHWSLEPGSGAASMALDPYQPVPGTALTESLRVDVTRAAASPGVGIANDGYWGIPVHPSTLYHASLYAKCSAGFRGPLSVSLENADGTAVYARAALPALTSTWKKYSVALTTNHSAPVSSTNQFVVSLGGAGTVWLTQVSLFPPTFNNRPNGARIGLMQLLQAIHPGFLRLPGGNYLEGNDIPNRFEWTRTIGNIADRPGHLDPWGYRSSDGFGLLEYLEWCQDMHMQPLLAIYAGYSLDGDYVAPGMPLQPFVQDALNEIQYVTGSIHTHWGAIRAADGHPAPFPLKYVEIGNEDFFDKSGSYDARFAQFYDAIKKADPALKLIATAAVKSRTPDVIDEHYYRSPQDFEADAHHYDSYSRIGPKIFVGEYASQEGTPTPDMNSALGDAAWMTGMERNADVVRLASYAPLLANINPGARQWGTTLIGLNALSSYGSPSYYVQELFSLYHGTHVVPTLLKGGSGLFVVSSRDTATGRLDVILVNAVGDSQTAQLNMTGAGTISPTGTIITLSARSPTETDMMTDPDHIIPVTAHLTGVSAHFFEHLPPYSVTVLQLKVH